MATQRVLMNWRNGSRGGRHVREEEGEGGEMQEEGCVKGEL